MANLHPQRPSTRALPLLAWALGFTLLACADPELVDPDAGESSGPLMQSDTSGDRADRFQTLDPTRSPLERADVQAESAADDTSAQASTPDGIGPQDSATQSAEVESHESDDAEVITTPGGPCEGALTEPCYEGPQGTSGVGPCTPGVRSCVDGVWGLCEGQVLPSVEAIALGSEVCTNGIDDDCDGLTDEDLDEDGDGFGACSLDCCDAPNQGCGALSAQVSPAAYDLPNNGVDDDCDGVTDGGGDTSCSEAAINANISAEDLVRAMDICRFVEEGELGWGVLEASLSLADGSGQPEDIQLHVSEGLGGLIAPLANQTMAVLSSGIARGVGDESFEDSNTHNAKTKSDPPQTYIDVHGALQTSPAL